ncbi:MAG: TonB-dependent receptor, partial [Acidobacteria bacterium]
TVGVTGAAEGQSAVPAIRGLARGRSLVLLDGGRLFSERRAGPSVSFLAPETADRIEVVRGAASVAYGSDAFGGVISIVTRTPSVGAPASGRLTGVWGAGVPGRRADAEVSVPLGARVAVLGLTRYRQAGDYSSPDGVVPNSAWRDRGGLVRALATAGGWWTASWQGDFVAASGLPRSDSTSLRVSMPFERSQRGSLTFDRSGVRWFDQVTATAGWGAYAQRVDQDRLPAPGRPRRIDRADIGGTDVQFRAVARTGVGRHRLTSGVDFNERHGVNAHDIGISFNAAGQVAATTDNASIASARKHNLGAFAQLDLPVRSRITLTVGGRVDRTRSVNTGGYFGDRAVSHQAASGSVALAIRPWLPLTITAQFSRGFHDPTLSDRFYRGPAGRGFIVGNPNLLPEHSAQVDLTARYDVGRWRASVSAYRYDIKDLIERYQSGVDTFLFRNRGLAEIRGAEAEAGIDVTRGLTLRLSGQAGRGRARDDGAALDDTPPRSVLFQLQQTMGARGFLSARVAVMAADNAPGPSEVASPGYVDTGATASWRVRRGLTLTAIGANLLNARSYSSASPRWVLAAGRNVMVVAALKF